MTSLLSERQKDELFVGFPSTYLLPPSLCARSPCVVALPRPRHSDTPCACRHKSILDYLYNSGLTTSYDALREETRQADFAPDPKGKHAGLLEKKWTSVIRLQKKVRLNILSACLHVTSLYGPDHGQDLVAMVLGKKGREAGRKVTRPLACAFVLVGRVALLGSVRGPRHRYLSRQSRPYRLVGGSGGLRTCRLVWGPLRLPRRDTVSTPFFATFSLPAWFKPGDSPCMHSTCLIRQRQSRCAHSSLLALSTLP